MAEGLSRERRASDRGDVPASYVIAVLLMVVVACVLSDVVVHGLSLSHDLLLFAGLIGVLIGMAVVLGVLIVTADWVQARRRRALDWRIGPVLCEFMDVDQLTDDELTQWRRCRRRGVTVEQAREWARAGLPYPLLLAAPGLQVERSAAQALAKVMVEAGAWDGRDRRRLVDLIGFHIAITGDKYPVLGRWLAFAPDTVRDRVAVAVANADLDRPHTVPEYRAAAAAEATLYALEDEHGIRGYRHRPQRSLHAKWPHRDANR